MRGPDPGRETPKQIAPSKTMRRTRSTLWSNRRASLLRHFGNSGSPTPAACCADGLVMCQTATQFP